MSFDLKWLDLREPADYAARDRSLLAQAAGFAGESDNPIVVDLGCGSGSTARAFPAHFEGRWRLVDHDPVLLEAAVLRSVDAVETFQADLRDIAALPLAGARLVTASALLDLASAEWIEHLADRVVEAGAGLYAALNYDGHMNWSERDAADEAVVAAFGRHQRRDKGFGPALGPDAAAYLAETMRARGYRVATAESPWRLGPNQADLQRMLLQGVAGAVVELGTPGAEDWLQRRLAVVSAGSCVVGHVDVLALPNSQSKITSVPSP